MYIYTYIIVCVHVCIYIHIYISHLLYLSIDEWLLHSHVLVIVTVLQWSWGCGYHFELVFLFSSDKYSEVKLLDHMAILLLIFWIMSMLFSIEAWPIYSPTNSTYGFPFIHLLANTYCLLSFWWSPFWQVWVLYYYLIYIFLMLSEVEHLLMCLWPSIHL